MKNKRIIYLLLFGMILMISEQNVYSGNINFSRDISAIFRVIEEKVEKKEEVKPSTKKFYLIYSQNKFETHIDSRYVSPNIFEILSNNILKFLE